MGTYVIEPETEIGRTVTELLDGGDFSVQSALWLYLPEPGEWRLVIATPLVDTVGPKRAYTELQRILSKGNVSIELRRISLVSPSDPLIQLLRRVVRTGPGISSIRLTRNTVDNVFIEDAYIYRLQ